MGNRLSRCCHGPEEDTKRLSVNGRGSISSIQRFHTPTDAAHSDTDTNSLSSANGAIADPCGNDLDAFSEGRAERTARKDAWTLTEGPVKYEKFTTTDDVVPIFGDVVPKFGDVVPNFGDVVLSSVEVGGTYNVVNNSDFVRGRDSDVGRKGRDKIISRGDSATYVREDGVPSNGESATELCRSNAASSSSCLPSRSHAETHTSGLIDCVTVASSTRDFGFPFGTDQTTSTLDFSRSTSDVGTSPAEDFGTGDSFTRENGHPTKRDARTSRLCLSQVTRSSVSSQAGGAASFKEACTSVTDLSASLTQNASVANLDVTRTSVCTQAGGMASYKEAYTSVTDLRITEPPTENASITELDFGNVDLLCDTLISDEENESVQTDQPSLSESMSELEPISGFTSDPGHHETAPKQIADEASGRGGGGEDYCEQVVERQLNIEHVGNLVIQVGGDVSMDDPPRRHRGLPSYPVCIRADWDAEEERAIQAQKQEAEQQVKKAQEELEKEKKRGVRRMASLAKKYIREWSEDVMEREGERERENHHLTGLLFEAEREADSKITSMRSQLQEEKRRREEMLAELNRRLQEVKDRHRNCVVFIIRPDHIDEQVMRMRRNHVLDDVIRRLHEEFNVRLLAVDMGLVFLMEVPVAQWEAVKANEEAIQRVLGQLIPRDVLREVRWVEARQVGGADGWQGVLLNQPLPSQILEAGCVPVDRCRGDTPWDPMTANLRRVFLEVPKTDADIRTDGPGVGALVVTATDRIAVLDWRNKMVKVMTFDNPSAIQGVRLQLKLFAMTLVAENVVAVTAPAEKRLVFVDVSGTPFVRLQHGMIDTERQYYGIAAVASPEKTLIVSTTRKDEGVVAGVYQINHRGEELRTIADCTTLPELNTPFHLCFWNCRIYASDRQANSVYEIDMSSGRLLRRLFNEEELKGPRQVTTDGTGNVYIASTESKRVLVVSRDGRWRRVLEGGKHGNTPRDEPIGIGLTKSGLVVSWHEWDGWSVVTGFQLEE